MKIPYAPVIQATVSDHDAESFETGTKVLTFQTRLTRGQMDNVDQIQQVTELMKETMEEILYG